MTVNKNIVANYQEYLEKAGKSANTIKAYNTLCHSFAKKLVDAGTPLDQVATLLGHESLATTRIYTQPSERDLEWTVRRAAGEFFDK
jgi:site-specific recombinase XerD